ncbi:MAG: 5-(carboxyamino)imidazole ribonucleotide mutase [Cellulosilyticaceae bacterium]
MKIAFVMGSDSDLPVVEKGIEVVKSFDIETEVRIISAHRTPAMAEQFAREAEKNGIGVIVAAAGKAAHLGGVLAAYTTLPVIALPIKSSTLDGLDSLLSMVQMPPGIPVATVAIDGAVNAGLLALQILGVSDADVKAKLKAYKAQMEAKVLAKDEEVRARFA